MIIQPSLKSGDIGSFKLIDGNEIVAKIIEVLPTAYKITKPINFIMAGPGQVLPVPYMFTSASDDTLTLNNDKIMVGPVKPSNQFVANYIEMTTGIKAAPPISANKIQL